jgi:hypothetical protein
MLASGLIESLTPARSPAAASATTMTATTPTMATRRRRSSFPTTDDDGVRRCLLHRVLGKDIEP